ncbi:CLUMA_CG012703, isoform A [Clunio marinus]|uniref:CLUMA_CG012703, isoform A n=1 Tax=Clunio marinus TaxID=568069 RepID=A0A1J1IGT8_9DIPT|nr:CLUMA_CG012703, isoform A [Clunio marinus]
MEVSSKISINNDKSLCLYCDKTFSNNLDFLFQHLLTSHKDVYFGCKCRIRTHDKVSLASHKKDCKIGGKSKLLRRLKGKSDDKHKTSKKLHSLKFNDERKFHTLSDKEEIFSTAVSNHSKTLPVNAILQKFDKNKLKKHSKMVCVNDKGNKIKNSDSSSRASSISSVKVAEEEYTIPLTRQKLKETPILSRVNTSHSRSSSVKKPVKLKQNTSSESKITTNPSPSNRIQRTKTTKFINLILHNNFETVENAQKNETVNVEFDEDFYKNISNNIRLNLNYFVDGKSDQLLNRPVFDQISEQSITSSAKDSTVHDKEIYEATNFKLSTPFPALLTAEQYGFGDSNPNKNKRQVTKNSWKWKWDLIKKYKYVNEGGKIVKKVKQITTGLKDLSQLDMWTQLSMRSRYENLNNQNDSSSVFDNGLKDRLSTRMIKTQNIEQLNRILDNRLTPEINIEQLEQTIIKIEAEEFEQTAESVDINVVRNESNEQKTELLKTFNLVKNDTSVSSIPTLSGEWARPRCYICIDCGLKFDLMKSLNDHKNSEHPYVVSAHYEIVGRENLELKLYKNLFLPKKAFRASGFARSLSVNSDSKSNETNEASASSDFSSKYFADQKEKVCSKCLKTIKYSSDIDINRHILDCIEDRAWLQAKRRSKYRKSRRKNRKSTKKSKTSFDQKKSTSSPSTKDNTEGENSTHSISNPPTPKNDVKPTAHISNIVNKVKRRHQLHKKLT